MSKIIDYYSSLKQDTKEATILSKTFINFYLYFKKLHEKKSISDNTIKYLEEALSFTEHVTNTKTEEYLNSKQYQMEQFLSGIKLEYDKIAKNLKRTFDIPNNYSYEEVCDLILQSYLPYASLRFKHNLHNSEVYKELFTEEQINYKLPKYIPDTNAYMKDFLEIVSGITSKSSNKKTFDWFNVFSESLNIRVVLDVSDTQIVAVFVNGEEHNEVPISFIKKLKQQIKNETNTSKK